MSWGETTVNLKYFFIQMINAMGVGWVVYTIFGINAGMVAFWSDRASK